MISRRNMVLVALAFFLGGLLPESGEARSVYKRGQMVRFEGQVTGTDGQPLSGLTVALEVSQKGYRLRGLSFKGLKREKRDALQVFTTTDSEGRYVIDWNWDAFYNVFELLAALPFEGSSQELDILKRIEITPRVEQSNPVVTSMTVEAGAFVGWLQLYAQGAASEDEARIYRELGRPDRFDFVREDRDLTEENNNLVEEKSETSWWYFELGKVYRFEAGSLEQVTHFEPVKELP